MFGSWFPHRTLLRWRRHRLRGGAERPSPLAQLLEAPLPDLGRSWEEVEYVVLDFETTGLDSRRDRLLSAGWVVMKGDEIRLATAGHRLIRPEGEIPESSAVIHCITDDRAAEGLAEIDVLDELLAVLAGRVLVAHNARFELAFLNAACRRHFASGLAMPVIDTLHLARRGFERRHLPHGKGELRLDSLRGRYHLPRYHAHHALVDALATAELFSALCQDRVGPEGRLPVRELLSVL